VRGDGMGGGTSCGGSSRNRWDGQGGEDDKRGRGPRYRRAARCHRCCRRCCCCCGGCGCCCCSLLQVGCSYEVGDGAGGASSSCLMLRASVSSRTVQPLRHAQVLRRQDRATVLILRTRLGMRLAVLLMVVRVRVRQGRGACSVVVRGILPRGGRGQGRACDR